MSKDKLESELVYDVSAYNYVSQIEIYSRNDHIGNIVRNTGTFYEIDLLNYITFISEVSRVDDNWQSVAVDVGANIGNHSVFFGKYVADYVLAVEPNPEVVDILRRNLSRNRIASEVIATCLGEKTAHATLVAPAGAECNVGMTRAVQVRSASDNAVSVLTLDSICTSPEWQNEKSVVSIIKIDVEGMELAVLKGATRTIDKNKPELFVEAQTDREFKEIDDYLRPLGYKKLSTWGATPVHHFSWNPALKFRMLVRFYLARKRAIFTLRGALRYIRERSNGAFH